MASRRPSNLRGLYTPHRCGCGFEIVSRTNLIHEKIKETLICIVSSLYWPLELFFLLSLINKFFYYFVSGEIPLIPRLREGVKPEVHERRKWTTRKVNYYCISNFSWGCLWLRSELCRYRVRWRLFVVEKSFKNLDDESNWYFQKLWTSLESLVRALTGSIGN